MQDKHIEQVNIIAKNKRRVYAFGFFTFIVVIIIIVGAIAPSVTTIIDISDEMDDKQATLETLEKKVDTLNNLSEQYEAMGEIREDFALLFPTTGDSSLFMANINSICDENGFEMTTIKFDDADNRDGSLQIFEPISVRIGVRGNKSRINTLLIAIEEMPTYPDIVNFSFSNRADNDGLFAYTIEIYTYIIDDPLFFE